MRIGVFAVLFQKLPFEAALDRIAAAGITAVGIGAGAVPARIIAPWTSCWIARPGARRTCKR
ncbi:MAG: hypothetical protein NT169_04230 [Chloroflexi bacterium]|nr:hypothetical protein [Chloroflexota bacterium]